MSPEAKASSQAAAQRLRNTNKQYTNEFAAGQGSIAQGMNIASQGYNAYSADAKARSQAASQVNRNQFSSEFGMGTGSMSKEASANSKATAQALRNANLPNNGNNSSK